MVELFPLRREQIERPRRLAEANVVAEDKLRKTALAVATLETQADRKEGWIN